MSKKQISCESLYFGSEFVAIIFFVNTLVGSEYKLCMIVIAVDGPAYIFGNNKSDICNIAIPDYTLKKKSQSIAYHILREGTAIDEWDGICEYS